MKQPANRSTANMKNIIHSSDEIQGDTVKLVKFVSMYCGAHHGDRTRWPFSFLYPKVPAVVQDGPPLCESCTRLLRHSIVMRVYCHLDPKPKCRKCPEHCYLPRYKEEMEMVMKYVGPRLLFRK